MIMPAVGQPLAALGRTLGQDLLIIYAGATWDWHKIHYDPIFVAESGLPSPVVDGQMFGAFFAKQIVDTFGPEAVVRSMRIRFHRLVPVNSFVEVLGEVEAVGDRNGAHRVSTSHRVTVDGSACVRGTAVSTIPPLEESS